MTDPTDKNGSGADPLASAMQRAQKAVQDSDGNLDLELDLDAASGSKPPPAPDNMDFGSIDLGGAGGGGSEDLELAAPKPKKPKIKTPALLQDEDWGEDDKWAEGAEGQDDPPAPSGQDEPAAPAPQKIRRAAPTGGPPPPTPQAAPQPQAAEEPVDRAPSIRVSRHESARRSYAGAIRVALIILAVLLVGVGGYFGYTKWQESKQSELDAQLNALDQGSLDSLKDQAANREKLGS